MALSNSQRELLKSYLVESDPVELFTIDNREVMDAMNSMITAFEEGRYEAFRTSSRRVFRLRGGSDQVGVLLELARESGLETTAVKDALVISIPEHSRFRMQVELPAPTERKIYATSKF